MNRIICFVYIVVLGLFAASAVQAQSPSTAELYSGANAATPAAAEMCMPTCRTGFTCHQGQCISLCNPGCGDGQVCDEAGECVASPDAVNLAARNQHEPHYTFSVRGGLLMPGPGTFGEYEHSVGPLLHINLDYVTLPSISLGYYGLYFQPGGASGSVLSNGVTIKARFNPSESLNVRLGLAIGHNLFLYEQDYDAEHGFNAGLIGEFAAPIRENLELQMEISFWSSPAGAWEVEPIFFVAAGIGRTF